MEIARNPLYYVYDPLRGAYVFDDCESMAEFIAAAWGTLDLPMAPVVIADGDAVIRRWYPGVRGIAYLLWKHVAGCESVHYLAYPPRKRL